MNLKRQLTNHFNDDVDGGCGDCGDDVDGDVGGEGWVLIEGRGLNTKAKA